MKANELRLNNLVYGVSDRIERITYITDRYVKTNLIKIDAESQILGVEHLQPIPLTEEWLLKLGFENWGKGKYFSNEYESYDRFVLHNVLDGTSNFEIHYIKSTYGDTEHYQYVISCDEDDRLNWGEEPKYIHQLQNLYFALTNNELEIL